MRQRVCLHLLGTNLGGRQEGSTKREHVGEGKIMILRFLWCTVMAILSTVSMMGLELTDGLRETSFLVQADVLSAAISARYEADSQSRDLRSLRPPGSRGMGYEPTQNSIISAMENNDTKQRGSVKIAWEDRYTRKDQEQNGEDKKFSQSSTKGRQSADIQDEEFQKSLQKTFTWKRLVSIFRSKTFPDKTLENLYRRYFIKVDQSSQSNMQVIIVIICVLLIFFYYISGSSSPIRGVVMGLIVVILAVLEVLLYRITLQYSTLQIICAVSLFLLVAIVCTVTLDQKPSDVGDGLWVTVFFVYMTYTGIPLPLSVAILMGLFLPLFQLALTTRFTLDQNYMREQVSCTWLSKSV
ncbi:hypothetical protein Btru_027409 [Bulinus truncatus]|nr:hypothetical protein Btru_027409 [Bulinus truncatus]